MPHIFATCKKKKKKHTLSDRAPKSSKQKSSVLVLSDGFGPECYLDSCLASAFFFSSFLFTSSSCPFTLFLLFLSTGLRVCVRENICVDPPAPSVIFMVLFVVLQWFQLSQVSRHSLYPSLLCRPIKWPGHSWSPWTQTTPLTTTGLSRNQWVSGGNV